MSGLFSYLRKRRHSGKKNKQNFIEEDGYDFSRGRLVLSPMSSDGDLHPQYPDFSPPHRAIQTLAQTSTTPTRNTSFREKKLILLSAETNPTVLNPPTTPRKSSVLFTVISRGVIDDLVRGDTRLHLSNERAGKMSESELRVSLPSFLARCELDNDVLSPLTERETVGRITILSEYESQPDEDKLSPDILDWRVSCTEIVNMVLPVHGPKLCVPPEEVKNRIAVFSKITDSIIDNLFYVEIHIANPDDLEPEHDESSPEFKCSDELPVAICWGHSTGELEKSSYVEHELQGHESIELDDSNSESEIIVLGTSGSYKSESDVFVLDTSQGLSEDEGGDHQSNEDSEVSTVDMNSSVSYSMLHCSMEEFLNSTVSTGRLVDVSPFDPDLTFEKAISSPTKASEYNRTISCDLIDLFFDDQLTTMLDELDTPEQFDVILEFIQREVDELENLVASKNLL